MLKNLLLFIFLLAGFFASGQNLLEEYFDDVNNFPAGWQNIDRDGDGIKWKLRQNSIGDKYAYSESWSNDVVLFPYNYLITREIDLTGLTGTVNLAYLVGAADPDYYSDHYKLCVSTTGTDTSHFSTILFEETTTIEAYETWPVRNIDLSSYKGQKIYLAWIHYNCSDEYRLLIDSIVVKHTLTSELPVTENVEVSVYPNPVKDWLQINGISKGSSIELLSYDGRMVYSAQSGEMNTRIDVSRYDKGLYVLRIRNKDQSIIKKVTIL
jgi:hypothetical protein